MLRIKSNSRGTNLINVCKTGHLKIFLVFLVIVLKHKNKLSILMFRYSFQRGKEVHDSGTLQRKVEYM
jgi:hypothetical protein